MSEGVQKKFQQIASFDVQKLIHAEHGEYSLEPAARDIASIHKMFSQLKDVPVESLPRQIWANIDDLASKALDKMLLAESWNPLSVQGQATKFRDERISELQDIHWQCVQRLPPLLVYLFHFENFGQLASTAAGNASQIKKLHEEAKALAADMAVSGHAKHFHREVRQNKSVGCWWLAGAGLLALAIVGLLLVCIFYPASVGISLDASTTAGAIQQVFLRVTLISVLFYVLIFCAKTSRAYYHNATVNQHRSNALNTFQVLANSVKDPQMREAILLKATEAIFSPQPSGFVAGERDDGGGLQVLEVFRQLGKPS